MMKYAICICKECHRIYCRVGSGAYNTCRHEYWEYEIVKEYENKMSVKFKESQFYDGL